MVTLHFTKNGKYDGIRIALVLITSNFA